MLSIDRASQSIIISHLPSPSKKRGAEAPAARGTFAFSLGEPAAAEFFARLDSRGRAGSRRGLSIAAVSQSFLAWLSSHAFVQQQLYNVDVRGAAFGLRAYRAQ